MSTLTIKSKYAGDEEKVLQGNIAEYKVDIASHFEASVRIFNHNAKNRNLFYSGIFKSGCDDEFEYCNIYIDNSELPIVALTQDNVDQINYRLELGTTIDDSCREYIEYVTSILL